MNIRTRQNGIIIMLQGALSLIGVLTASSVVMAFVKGDGDIVIGMFERLAQGAEFLNGLIG